MKYIFVTIIALFSGLISAQDIGVITGKLLDKEYNNEPLPFANVILKGTTRGATSDFDGLFTLDNLDVGSHIIEVSFVGYTTQEITVEVVANKTTRIIVIMEASAASLDEVLIQTTTKRESETALLLEQKKAVEIKQSIGAEELSRKGVSDAAGAVAKISGVSKQEGSSNVYVRGLGDRYLNTTMNGLSLPSNDVNKKNIDLGLFSSDIIENVSISKAYSSRFYTDFAAGNVDISSKDYNGTGFFDAYVGGSINTNAADKTFLKNEGTSYFGYYNRYDNNPFAVVLSHGVDAETLNTPIALDFGTSFGKSFNFENGSRLSFYATGSFGNTYNYRKGNTTDYTNVEKKVFEVSEEYEYSTKTTAMTAINFIINSENSLKFNSLFINNSSNVVGFFGIDGKGKSRDAINTDEGFFQKELKFSQNLTYVNQLLGKHNFSKINIDWGIGYNLVNAHEPDRKRFTLENYQLALDNDSSTNPTFYNNVNFDNQRYFQNIEDSEINGRINIAYEVSDNFKLNFGYNGRSKERDFNNIRYGLAMVNSNVETTNINELNTIFNLNTLKGVNGNENGLYELKVIRNLSDQIGNTNTPGLPENTYNGLLDVASGYVNAEIHADNNTWLFVPGIRIEAIKQTINYDVINLGNLGVGTNESLETVFSPSLSIKYALNEDQNLRFSASQTISLPEFKEVAPFVYESISQRIGGNPDLLGRSSNPDIAYNNVKGVSYSKVLNLDLKYDWFITKSELLSFGVFYKQIKDPINQVVAFDATGTQRYFRTGEKATILGFEAEIRKNFIVDTEENTILSGGLNFTYMHTEQDLYDNITGIYSVSFRNNKEELQGASPILINADINYSPTFGTYKPTGNLVFSYFSDRIDALGSGQLENVIEKGVPALDFILKNKLTQKLELNFAVKNILNPTIKYTRNTPDGEFVVTSPNAKGVSDYRNGLDVGFQLNYKF